MNVPERTVYSVKEDAHSTAVYSVQRALNALSKVELTEDGIYGESTKAAVRSYQNTRNLYVDGVCGPKTQARLARSLIAQADPDDILPEKLMLSMVEGESGALIAAVNWSVAGGVDVGYVQRRLFEPYEQAAIRRGFDSLYQLKLARRRIVNLWQVFLERPAVATDEWAIRLAVLNHNYPAAADRLSRTHPLALSAYWTTPQKWVQAIGARFADGTPCVTPLQHCQRYSLGNAAHKEPGRMVRLVDWT